VKDAGTACHVDPGDCAFAQPDIHLAGADDRSEELCQVGVVANDQHIFVGTQVSNQLFELGDGGSW